MNTTQATARDFYASIDAQDWTTVERLVTPDFAALISDGPAMSLTGWRRRLTAFHDGFPDGHHIIDDYVVTDDRVVTRCRFEGTHTGVFQGIGPTGRRVSAGVIHIDHLGHGRIERHYGQLNMLGLFEQLGVAPTIGA